MSKIELKNSVSDLEQRVFIKFGVLLNRTAKEIAKDLKKALGKKAYSYSSVHRWAMEISEGRNDTEETRGGAHHIHPEAEKRIEDVKEKLRDRRGWSMRELARQLQIPSASPHRILTKVLGLKKVLGKWIPHELTEDQMKFRIIASRNNLLRFRRNTRLLKRTLAIDETWVHLYAPPAKDKARFWLGADEKKPIIARQELRERKRMLIMAMDLNGITFWELCEEEQTVTAERYKSFLQRNLPTWMAKNKIKKPIIAHDNARPHMSRIITDYFRDNNIETWIQPPYSPDLQPCDYNCFGPLKRELKGKRYNNFSELSSVLNNTISKGLQDGLFRGVRMLPERWQRVIDNNGSYI